MPEIYVALNISPEEMHKYYSGHAENVKAVSTDGRMVQFPARILRPFLTHSGICGTFCLRYDDKGKFQDISLVC